MNFVLLQQNQDLLTQYMSPYQVATLALIAVLIYAGYQMAKSYGWI